MFSKILDLLDKPHRDDVYNYLCQNNKFNRTREWFGFSVVLILIGIIVGILFLIKNFTYVPPALFQVNENTLKNNTYHNRLIALNKPRITQNSLERWSVSFVNDFYNLNFNNFNQKINEDKKWFTPAGYNAFIESLQKIGLYEQLTKEKQMITLTTSARPIVKNVAGEVNGLDGKNHWQVEVEAIMATTSGFTVYKNIQISMILVYENDNKDNNGLYVHNMTMTIVR